MKNILTNDRNFLLLCHFFGFWKIMENQNNCSLFFSTKTIILMLLYQFERNCYEIIEIFLIFLTIFDWIEFEFWMKNKVLNSIGKNSKYRSCRWNCCIFQIKNCFLMKNNQNQFNGSLKSSFVKNYENIVRGRWIWSKCPLEWFKQPIIKMTIAPTI